MAFVFSSMAKHAIMKVVDDGVCRAVWENSWRPQFRDLDHDVHIEFSFLFVKISDDSRIKKAQFETALSISGRKPDGTHRSEKSPHIVWCMV